MEQLFSADSPEAYLDQLSEQRDRERDACAEFASVVAYQQLLLNHLSMAYVTLKRSESSTIRSSGFPSFNYPTPGAMK